MARPTMRRIAGELGVSVMTVSKVLNNHGDISEATRDRVLAKIEEVGYQRNAVARSLTLRRSHTIGIVIPDLMHSFFVEIIAGIEPIASVRGYGLLLCSSGEDPAKERAELEMLRSRQVDGIVLASAHGSENDDLLRQLTGLGTAMVMIDRDDHPKVECHRVLTDDERVGVLATSHLLDLGRKAIGHIGGPAHRAREAPREGLARHAEGEGRQGAARLVRAGRFHGERRLSRDEAAAVGAPAPRRGVCGQRSGRDRRDEGHLGSRSARAGRHCRRRRRRYRAQRSAESAADDRRLVAQRSGAERRGAAAERPRQRRQGRRRAASSFRRAWSCANLPVARSK